MGGSFCGSPRRGAASKCGYRLWGSRSLGLGCWLFFFEQAGRISGPKKLTHIWASPLFRYCFLYIRCHTVIDKFSDLGFIEDGWNLPAGF
jgi:hypothetical protein